MNLFVACIETRNVACLTDYMLVMRSFHGIKKLKLICFYMHSSFDPDCNAVLFCVITAVLCVFPILLFSGQSHGH
jgi:hypothetical protein